MPDPTREDLDAARGALLPGECLEMTVARLVRERDDAVRAEREACAATAHDVAEKYGRGNTMDEMRAFGALDAEAAIRARK